MGSSESSQIKEAVSEYVKIDYSKSATQVFAEAAQYIYRQYPTLMLSLASQTSSSDLELPSWVVDWTTPMRCPLSWSASSDWTWVRNFQYNASSDMKELSINFGENQLHLLGFQIDGVGSRGSHKRAAFRLSAQATMTVDSWLCTYADFIQDIFESELEEFEEILCKIPTAGDFCYANRLFGPTLAGFREVSTFAKRGSREITDANLSDDARAYRSVCMDFVRFRLPFISSAGRLGLGPDTLATDDAIFILSGVDTPFIFRRLNTGQYRLIGECYLHGVMDGEAVIDEVALELLEVV